MRESHYTILREVSRINSKRRMLAVKKKKKNVKSPVQISANEMEVEEYNSDTV